MILSLYPSLTPDDVRSTGMGQSGEDIQLSPAARSLLPISIECKSRAAIAVYGMYEQAVVNAKQGEQPLLVIKQNHSDPLVVVDADWFFRTYKNNENKQGS